MFGWFRVFDKESNDTIAFTPDQKIAQIISASEAIFSLLEFILKIPYDKMFNERIETIVKFLIELQKGCDAE